MSRSNYQGTSLISEHISFPLGLQIKEYNIGRAGNEKRLRIITGVAGCWIQHICVTYIYTVTNLKSSVKLFYGKRSHFLSDVTRGGVVGVVS